MRLVNVHDRVITVELAAACADAREALSSYQDHRLGVLLDAFATTLELAAMAGATTEDGDRSLASFRRDYARSFPRGVPPSTPGEAPPGVEAPSEHTGLAIVHLAAD